MDRRRKLPGSLRAARRCEMMCSSGCAPAAPFFLVRRGRNLSSETLGLQVLHRSLALECCNHCNVATTPLSHNTINRKRNKQVSWSLPSDSRPRRQLTKSSWRFSKSLCAMLGWCEPFFFFLRARTDFFFEGTLPHQNEAPRAQLGLAKSTNSCLFFCESRGSVTPQPSVS